MAGRPPLPIGAHGNIKVLPLGPKLHEARCRVRDADGVTRQVRATGKSISAATTALKKALTDRQHNAGATLTGSSRVREAAELWLAHVEEMVAAGDRAPRTLDTYRSTLQRHVLPALGELRLREATTSRCEAWLRALRKAAGPAGASKCRTARTVLSGLLGYAARMDAIEVNPVPGLSAVPGSRTRKPRAMTREERDEWLAWMDTHVAADPNRKSRRPPPPPSPEVIASRALGDITRFMLGTGVRIGEAMAVGRGDVDLHAGTVAIRWHIVRVTGQGLVRMEGAKSEAGDRLLRLPDWCAEMLRVRLRATVATPLFPDSYGSWRDPNLVARWLRWSRDEAGYSWVTSHVFRQTVIKMLDAAGLPTSEVADVAGHARISQTHDYIQRGIASERAAVVLEGMFGAG